MIKNVFAIRDAKAELFGNPFYEGTKGSAIRAFSDLVNREDGNNMVNRHPGDYALFHLGTYDDSDGKFVSVIPALLVQGNEVIETKISKV